MAISKVVYGNRTLLDISGDSVTADKLLQNETAHGSDGSQIVGTLEAYSNETLLWSNNDFSSAFAAQNLGGTISCNDYKAFRIEWSIGNISYIGTNELYTTLPSIIVKTKDLQRMSLQSSAIAEKGVYEIDAMIRVQGRTKSNGTLRNIRAVFSVDVITGEVYLAFYCDDAYLSNTTTKSNKTAIPAAIYGLN